MLTQINTEFGMYNIASSTAVKSLTFISCFKNVMLINAIHSYRFFTRSNNYYKYEKLSDIISFSSGCSTPTRDKTEEQGLH